MAGQKKKTKKDGELEELRHLSGKSLAALINIREGKPFDVKRGNRTVMMQAITVDNLEHYRDLDERVEDGRLVDPADYVNVEVEQYKNAAKAAGQLLVEERAEHKTAINALAVRLADQLRINEELREVNQNQRDFITKLANEEVPEETEEVEDGGLLDETMEEFYQRVKKTPFVQMLKSEVEKLMR